MGRMKQNPSQVHASWFTYLTKVSTPVKLFEFLLSNPEKSYHLRLLARSINEAPNQVYVHLKNLVKYGAVSEVINIYDRRTPISYKLCPSFEYKVEYSNLFKVMRSEEQNCD